MRHMIKTVCCLMLVAAVQGTALADKLPVPPPPPTTPNSCPAVEECKNALNDCGEDVKALLAADCKGDLADKLREKYGVGTDTTVVVTPTPPKGKWRTRIEDVPAGDKRCPNGGTVEMTGRDKNRNGKLDDKEVTGRSYACKGDAGGQGPEGPAGARGEKGDRGSDGLSSLLVTVKEPAGKNCQAGGQHLMFGLDGNRDTKLQLDEVDGDSFICNGVDGKSGSNGRPGEDGNTRIQVGLGFRHSAVISKGRPTGYSAAPELQVEYWLSPTWEFEVGMAWAWGEDRNMVVTSQLCRRGLGSMFGFCLGGQYQAWNLKGNLALWHSGLATAALKFVPVESKYVDLSFEAGPLVGFDGYDDDMQFAYGWTGGAMLSGKF